MQGTIELTTSSVCIFPYCNRKKSNISGEKYTCERDTEHKNLNYCNNPANSTQIDI